MCYQILVVEDESRMRQVIANYLKQENYTVVEAENGQEAIDIFGSQHFDLVILDIMLPVFDGWTVCRSIRKNSMIPIIMLTAKSQEEDKLSGYELGADDYITKPFSLKILVAKVNALLKRMDMLADRKKHLLDVNGLRIDALSHEVYADGQLLVLTAKEYDLLLYMASNKGIALTRSALLNGVWGYSYCGDTRTVDTHIKRLREKLGNKAAMITTIRGSGYKFEVLK
ncbi:MAG TPA: response regulator transcription factor [Clostridia bacterium]|nr:response regulator transcription factor [Clostridia bacterium]